jgi:hypothetical protein
VLTELGSVPSWESALPGTWQHIAAIVKPHTNTELFISIPASPASLPDYRLADPAGKKQVWVHRLSLALTLTLALAL